MDNVYKPVRSSLGKWLGDLPIPRKFALIFSSFILIIFVLLSAGYFGMSILSDVRAFVGAEGLWSKAQKDAVYHLTRYLIFEEEKDRLAYLTYIRVPLGHRQARLELKKPAPDMAVVRQGFLDGGSHPDDVKGMTRFFRQYAPIFFIKNAMRLWEEADARLSSLIDLGEQITKEVRDQSITPGKRGSYLLHINEINEKLTPIEDRFSYTLGKGARWLKDQLLFGMFGIAVILVAIGLWVGFWISRHLIREIHALREAADRIAKGDFSPVLEAASRDEIGDLVLRFKEMKTQRQKVEEELLYRARDLNKANEQLVETERQKNHFFATVSHELRTPLTLVLSPIESLLSGNYGNLDDSQMQILQTMHNNAVRLLQMVTGLLDFSKLEAGRMELKQVPTDMVSLTRGIFSDFLPIIQKKGLNPELNFGADKIPVMIDRYLYERILFNLLSNAVKFTDSGGHVGVSLNQNEGTLVLKVEDSGIGIPHADHKHLFKMFRQVGGSSMRRHEGTGLGLALVKEFTELLKGTASVESKPQKGSVFTVHLPVTLIQGDVSDAADPTPSKSPIQKYDIPLPVVPRRNPKKQDGRPKVLVAEDNSEMAAYVSELLSEICEIRLVEDGVAALDAVHEWRPDMVLADIMMPRRDGLSLCREIKSDEKTASIPVVLLTAMTHREALLQGWEAGADDYLFKPFHPTELLTRIRALLSITLERRKIEERTIRMNEELERKVGERTEDLKLMAEELRQFSFIASHDLREPLRKIRAFGDLLKEEGGQLTKQGASYLERIQDASKRMEQLIGSLRVYSMIELREEAFVVIDLNDVLKDILSDLELRIKETGARIVSDALPKVRGNRVQLGQLFQNLLVNALKFHDKSRPPEVNIRCQPWDTKFIQIFIEDNGIGFEDRFIEQIFKPFQRLHSRQTYEGLGMGLAICQKIVHKHGGTIAAKSQVGVGSTFFLTLPLVEEPVEARNLEEVA